MRRNARALIAIVLLVVGAVLTLSFQTIELGNFSRGGDTLLGLSLGLDLQGGSHLVYQGEPTLDRGGELLPPTAEDMESLKLIIERRVNSSGLGEPIVQILGEDRLLIQLPGVDDPERAKALIGETAQLVFRHRQIVPPRNLATEGVVTDADVVSVSAEPIPEELLPESEAGTEGSSTEADPIPVIIVEMTPAGAARFDEVLARLSSEFNVAAATANVFTFQSQLQAGYLPSLRVTINGNESLDGIIAPPAISKLAKGRTCTLCLIRSRSLRRLRSRMRRRRLWSRMTWRRRRA